MDKLLDCEFIINLGINYYVFNDFVCKRKHIKKVYENMVYEKRRIYKYYVYANVNMNNRKKDIIWDYLNESVEENELFKFCSK